MVERWANGHYGDTHQLCKLCGKAVYFDGRKPYWRHVSYLNERGEWIMPMTRCYDGPWDTTPKATPPDER